LGAGRLSTRAATTTLVTVPGGNGDANAVEVHVDQVVARKRNDSRLDTPRFVAVRLANQKRQSLAIDSDGADESGPTVNGHQIAILMGCDRDRDRAETIGNLELECHRL
jgi:hypothetical protein